MSERHAQVIFATALGSLLAAQPLSAGDPAGPKPEVTFGVVAACFSGHNHGGNYGEKHGIHYVTLQGLVETPDTAAYAVVALDPDRLVITGHGRDPSRILCLSEPGTLVTGPKVESPP